MYHLCASFTLSVNETFKTQFSVNNVAVLSNSIAFFLIFTLYKTHCYLLYMQDDCKYLTFKR